MSAIGPARRPVTTTLSQLDDVPLFMQELPPADAKENDALEALRSLIYDDTPEGIAASLKEQANDLFKQRKFKQALSFYSQAINEVGDKLPVETQAIFYSNRAACHLELQNYGSCVRDCSVTIKLYMDASAEVRENLSATRQKALYRSAKALIALEKLDQALDALENLAKLQQANPDSATLTLISQVETKIAKLQKTKTEHEVAQKAQDTLQTALSERFSNLHLLLPHGTSIQKALSSAPPPFRAPHFDDGYDQGEYQPLLIPVFILRPTNAPPSRDLIPEWAEDVTIQDQLAAFDPGLLDFDFYTITQRGRILKLGKKMTLQSVGKQASTTKDGAADGLTLVSGWSLEFYAVEPGSKSSEWISEMKRDLKARGLVV